MFVQHDTYRYLLTITDAFYQLSAFSLSLYILHSLCAQTLFPSLSIFCIVYVHRHWHVRINTQRERERDRDREKKTHTHTRTQTHTCAIGPKMHRLMKSSMRTHVCIIYINMYNIHIYTRILRCYSKFVGKLFYIIPTNWRNGKGSQTWPLAFWPA